MELKLTPDEPLTSSVSVLKMNQCWVIKEDDSYWCDLLDNGWTDEPDEEALPPLTFETEQEAITAYHQAQLMYSQREERSQRALDLINSFKET